MSGVPGKKVPEKAKEQAKDDIVSIFNEIADKQISGNSCLPDAMTHGTPFSFCKSIIKSEHRKLLGEEAIFSLYRHSEYTDLVSYSKLRKANKKYSFGIYLPEKAIRIDNGDRKSDYRNMGVSFTLASPHARDHLALPAAHVDFIYILTSPNITVSADSPEIDLKKDESVLKISELIMKKGYSVISYTPKCKCFSKNFDWAYGTVESGNIQQVFEIR